MSRLPQVAVLLGGLGSRLGELAAGLPKAMVPVAGRPFLEYQLEWLARQKFERFLFLVGFRAGAVMDHFGDGDRYGVKIEYSLEHSPMGTGGALKSAANLAERFLLLYGDLYREFDFASFSRSHEVAPCLAVYEYTSGLSTISAGNVELSTDRTKVIRYQKNSPDGLKFVDAGFGVFPGSVVSLLPEGLSSFEEVVYPQLAAAQFDAEVVDRNFFDIGNPADLHATRAAFEARRGEKR